MSSKKESGPVKKNGLLDFSKHWEPLFTRKKVHIYYLIPSGSSSMLTMAKQILYNIINTSSVSIVIH